MGPKPVRCHAAPATGSERFPTQRWAARAVARPPATNEARRQSKEKHLMPTTEDMKTRQGHAAGAGNDDKLASRFDPVERRRFPALLGVGGSLAAVIVIVAFVADAGL